MSVSKKKRIEALEQRVAYLEQFVGKLIDDMIEMRKENEKPKYFK